MTGTESRCGLKQRHRIQGSFLPFCTLQGKLERSMKGVKRMYLAWSVWGIIF
jgi:hypothetical protein